MKRSGLLLTLFLTASWLTGSGQTDSILCFPVNEAKELLIGYEQNKACDSVLILSEEQINIMDREITILEEYRERDSIQLMLKDNIIDMADKEVRKQKNQKIGAGILGILGIIVLLLL